MERLLTLREVAQILRASPTTLRIWASKKKIPIIKVGRLVRVSPKALEDWLQARTFEGPILPRPERRKARGAESEFDESIKELRRAK